LKNIELARDRILEAIRNNEVISIFADVDNDGETATAIKYNYLSKFTDNVSYFHSQRSVGHGINSSMHLVPKGTQLLIIVDSSSNDTKECKILQDKGIDVIILDHHKIEEINPHCILVNPQQEDCPYPNKKVSGSVVAWKMTQVLDDALDSSYSNDYFDLAAIGLLGDQMNMLEYENRYIVQQGLDNVKNKGIKALLSVLGKENDRLSATDILFSIAPTLNAAARLDQLEVALSLLTEQNPKVYKQLAIDIVKLNEKRKVTQAGYYKELVDLINPSDRGSIIINNTMGAGYRGLLSGDFSTKFNKPVMVLTEAEDGIYKGSFRSNDYDLLSLLKKIPQVIHAGGHDQAGGVSFKRKDLKKVQDYLNKHLPEVGKDNVLEYILEVDLDYIEEDLIKNVEEFYRINGNGFEVGRFKINSAFILDKKILGKEKNTIKLEVCHVRESNHKKVLSDQAHYDRLETSHVLMRFRTSEDYISDKLIHKEVSVVGTLNLNIYKNPRTGKTSRTKQVFIEDYQLVY
jgi:single-stranded-DNA-specific exonuclease